MSCTRWSPSCESRSRLTASYSYRPCCALVVDLMCHSSSGSPTAFATSTASMVLPVPGSPFTSSGRLSVIAALTASVRSSVDTYASGPLNRMGPLSDRVALNCIQSPGAWIVSAAAVRRRVRALGHGRYRRGAFHRGARRDQRAGAPRAGFQPGACARDRGRGAGAQPENDAHRLRRFHVASHATHRRGSARRFLPVDPPRFGSTLPDRDLGARSRGALVQRPAFGFFPVHLAQEPVALAQSRLRLGDRRGAARRRFLAFALSRRSDSGGEQPVRGPQERRALLRHPHRAQDREDARGAPRGGRDRQPRRGAEGALGGNAQADGGGGVARTGSLPRGKEHSRRADEMIESAARTAFREGKMRISLVFAVLSCLACLPAHAQTAGNAEAAKGKNSMCIGCHGIPMYKTAFPEVYSVPMIAGQSPEYIVKALQAYRIGERSHPSMRGVAKSLSDQDMADVAAHYGGAGKAGKITNPLPLRSWGLPRKPSPPAGRAPGSRSPRPAPPVTGRSGTTPPGRV